MTTNLQLVARCFHTYWQWSLHGCILVHCHLIHHLQTQAFVINQWLCSSVNKFFSNSLSSPLKQASNHHDALQVSLPGKRRLIPRFKRTALGSSSLGVIVESGKLIFCTFGLKGCFTSFFDLNLEKSCPASILGGA